MLFLKNSIMCLRPTIPAEGMLGVAQDNYMFKAFCAVFLTYHTQWENKGWCVSFENFELTLSRGQYTVPTYCISQLTQLRLSCEKTYWVKAKQWEEKVKTQ